MTIAQFFSPEDQIVDLTEEEEKLLTMWTNMSDFQKQLVLAYIQGMQDANAANEK